jgi:hypothetical protein
MSTFKKVLLVVAVLFGACILTGLLVPPVWNAEASVVIDAPRERIHGLLDDFHQWRKWSSPEQVDPNTEYAYEGPDSGVGAVQRWAGERSRGMMKILSSDPAAGLEFETAMLSTEVNGTASIGYADEGGKTRVTWQGHGSTLPVVGHLFRGTIGRGVTSYYEHALGQLKELAEQAPEADAPGAEEGLAAPDAGAPLAAADAGVPSEAPGAD